MFNIDTKLSLIVFGVLFSLVWAVGLFWKWKSWYFNSKRGVYAYLPISLLFITAAFEAEVKGLLGPAGLYTAYLLFLAVAVWWTVKTPVLLKPWWVKEIEARPPHLYRYLKEVTRKDRQWQDNLSDEQTFTLWLDRMEKLAKKKKK